MNENIENKIEKCVICGCETPYHFNDNISQRKYFVEGAGQLCQKCFEDIYRKGE